ncbi:MAG: hypothetical protein AAFX04_06170 [Pseudomonadota bacterium]
MKRLAALCAVTLLVPVGSAAAQTGQEPVQDEESEARIMLSPDMTASDMVDIFRDFCFAPFPSETDFRRAMEDNVHGLSRDRNSRAPWRWDNGAVRVDYVTPAMARGAMPAPQCAVATTIATAPDHLSIAGSINRKLLIGNGESSGRRGRNTTIWTFENEAGEHLRIFFKSSPDGKGRLMARLIVMRLPEYVSETL